MHNWSTDTKELVKNTEKYTLWRLEQLINFGLGGEKLDRNELVKYWGELDIEPDARKLLALLLYGTRDKHTQ